MKRPARHCDRRCLDLVTPISCNAFKGAAKSEPRLVVFGVLLSLPYVGGPPQDPDGRRDTLLTNYSLN